ncbi:hypothetical protein Sru01_37680 [Sphaerisporangium rufum]|uniref:Fungal lipase-type domain-containing protein n=1 Tax=Sphaerisporangium rufum TaxID=1381558 RepID=A0A919R313_9ACTN|nr:lipase family protein [Sphaerisporangium rufum]GII78786.1 hypothetical protein Sru01_37680 [Sphaerisporangium rufum]
MAGTDGTGNSRQGKTIITGTGAAAGRVPAAGGASAGESLFPTEWEGRMRDVLAAGGVWNRDAAAPSYDELRPYGHRETPGFPVYKDLERRLLAPGEHPDPVIAHVMATCAAYSYADPRTLSMIMARLGLADNRCRMIRASVDAMLICSTAFLVQSRSGRVGILCYRGTEPLNFVNWLGVLDVAPERIGYRIGDPCATVHAGLYRNVRATRYEVMNALRLACEHRSVRAAAGATRPAGRPGPLEGGLEVLYITGHSQGGAMAALMGVMMRHERKYRDVFASRLRAVYTFGQPMIGDPRFAEACRQDDFLRERVIRYVYDRDVVPHLPSTASGAFRHFGRELRYAVPHLRNTLLGTLTGGRCAPPERRGRWESRRSATPQMPGLLGIPLAGLAYLARGFEVTRSLPSVYSIDDHLPQHYVSALTPPGVQNEFGD